MKRHRLLATVPLLLAMSLCAAAGERVFKGKLNPELQPSARPAMVQLKAATAEAIAKLPERPAEDAEVFTGNLNLSKSLSLPVFFVHPKVGDDVVYMDLDGKGSLKRLALIKDRPAEMKDGREIKPAGTKATIVLPADAKVGMYKSLPAVFSYMERQMPQRPAAQPAAKPAEKVETPAGAVAPAATLAAPGTKPQAAPSIARMLVVELNTVPTATIKIDGKPTMFQYAMDFEKHTIDPLNGPLGVDCNGNGTIDGYPSNVEDGVAKGQPVVFRVGTHYLATKSVDIKKGKVIVESHPASDYTRIELLEGAEVPNFPFKDLDGKDRQLSDYRGKYVLLDFWGTW